jgi:hypothetical protein
MKAFNKINFIVQWFKAHNIDISPETLIKCFDDCSNAERNHEILREQANEREGERLETMYPGAFF